MKKIFFLDTCHHFLPRSLADAGFEIVLADTWDLDRVLKEIHQACGIVIRSSVPVDAKMIAAADNLKFVARLGAGLENIDVTLLKHKNIACLSAPEGNRDAVGEHCVAMILCLLNSIHRANAQVKQGLWLREENRGIELGGKKISIIGYGNMGGAFARKLRGFDVDVKCYDLRSGLQDKWARQVSMEEVYHDTDILSLHTPLTDLTLGMVSESFISRFKKPFYLINTARGTVVDTQALCSALDKGKILGACLDVLSFEGRAFNKVSFDDPLFKNLSGRENVLLTPHIAGWSEQSWKKMAQILFDKIQLLHLS